MGLIGAALAEGVLGGLAGVGQAGANVGKQWEADIHEKEKQEAMAMRQENLARLNNTAAMERLNVSEAGANTRTGITEAGATTRQAQLIQSNIDLHRIDREFRLDLANQTEKAAMDRLEKQLASAEKIHRESQGLQRELHAPAAELAREQLGTLKAVSMLRTSMSNAVAEGDTKSADLLGKRIEALVYSGDKNDTAGLIAIAGTAGKLAASLDATPEDKQVYGSIMRVALNKALGNKDASPPASAAQWDNKTGDVFVGGVKVGNAKSQEDAMRIARTPPAAQTPAAAPAATPRIVNRVVTPPASQSPLGQAGDAVTGAATNAIEAVANSAEGGRRLRETNQAIREKIRNKETLTADERRKAINAGWIRE